MPHFREINTATLRRIDRMMLGLADVATLKELERRFLEESQAILPADCRCWNNWQPDWSRMINVRTNSTYEIWINEQREVFDRVVEWHPVIRAGHFPLTAESVKRASDFQGIAEFRNNPLFFEIYRHMDSHYQLSYTVTTLEDRKIILTWNRRAMDFTERDRQVLHYMGLRLEAVSRGIEARQQLGEEWGALRGFIDARGSGGSLSGLATNDVRLLREILQKKPRGTIAIEMGIRRDSVDKRLGAIRERLGLENHHQLLSALAELEKSDPTGSRGADAQ